MLKEFDRDRRWNTTSLIDLSDLSQRLVVFDLSSNDAYEARGRSPWCSDTSSPALRILAPRW
jgi:hypothetical protein